MGACRLQEWLHLCNSLGAPGATIERIIVGVSADLCSKMLNYSRAAEAHRVSRGWLYPVAEKRHLSETISRVCDPIETAIVLGLEVVEELGEHLGHWTQLRPVGQRIPAMRPNEVYRLNGFQHIYASCFGGQPISTAWLDAISSTFRDGQLVADLGAGTGRLSLELLNLGLRVAVIEEHSSFAERCRKVLITNGWTDRVTLIAGQFPSVGVHGNYDGMVLHQNVFLELVNECPLDYIWKALWQSVAPGGHVVFDYPKEFCPPAAGMLNVLVRNLPVEAGSLCYGYTYLQGFGQTHQVRLHLEQTYEDGFSVVQAPLMLVEVPSLNDVLASAERTGFKMAKEADLEQQTFYPGNMSLVCLQK